MAIANLWWLGILLVIPLSWAWISKLIWPHSVTFKEMCAHFGIVLVVASVLYFGVMVGKTADTEIWNGEVTSKKKTWVSCEHSYQCNCVTSTDSQGNSSTTCQTCYDHSNDWDWRVHSNVQDYSNIRRVDRRGNKEPPRFTAVKIGEPYSDTKHFQNYIKGAPDSIFNDKGVIEKFGNLIPEYPNNIHDYYKVNRVITVGVGVKQIGLWNQGLSERLKKLGPSRKANVVIVIAKTDDIQYAKALKEAWLGGKKNDTVVVLGVKNYPKISFVDLFSWSKNKTFEVELRNRLQELPDLDREQVLDIISSQVSKNFVKRSMEEYAYLQDEAVPPTWLLITVFLLSFAISGAASWWTVNND